MSRSPGNNGTDVLTPVLDKVGSGEIPKRHQPHVTKALEKLRELIGCQGLQPGMKLPSERELAARFGVGRPMLREAIKALSMLDVVESRCGDGTYIKSLGGLNLGWSVKLDKIEENFDMIELLEVRKMFEPRAAALAAARANQKQLHEIEREVRIQEAHVDDPDLFVRRDYSFHDAIIRAAGNTILFDLARVLAPLLLKSRHITLGSRIDFQKGFQQHVAIFEAIRLRQSELAERAMLEHLQTVALDFITQGKR